MASTPGRMGDVYAYHGDVLVNVNPVYCDMFRPMQVNLTPDEARLLALRLIRLADRAESADG